MMSQPEGGDFLGTFDLKLPFEVTFFGLHGASEVTKIVMLDVSFVTDFSHLWCYKVDLSGPLER